MAKQYDLGKVVGEMPIDDVTPSADKVYSSHKTQNELDQLSQQIENFEGVGLKSDPQEDESTESPEMGSVPINADQLGGMTYKQIVDLIYPIGRTITTLDDADNPNTLYPWQEWERTAKGRFIVGTGDPIANDDGTLPGGGNYALNSRSGEAAHALTGNELANHDHGLGNRLVGWPNESPGSEDWSVQYVHMGESKGPYAPWYSRTEPAGDGQPHNNMPPYLAANIWKRVK